MKMMRFKKGQAMVELAIILPVFILLIVGIIDFGRYVLDFSMLNNAVREGTRYAVVQKGLSSSNDAAIRAVISQKITISDYNPSSPIITYPASKIKISISYNYSPITPGMNLIFGAIPINVQSEMFLTPYAK